MNNEAIKARKMDGFAKKLVKGKTRAGSGWRESTGGGLV